MVPWQTANLDAGFVVDVVEHDSASLGHRAIIDLEGVDGFDRLIVRWDNLASAQAMRGDRD